MIDEALRLYPAGVGAVAPLARRRRRRRPRGPGRDAGDHQPVAACTAAPTRGPTRWPSVPERFLDSGTARPHRLPPVRAGAAAVHRSRVRAGRDGAGAERAAARPPAVDVPPGWTRPGRAGAGRRPPARAACRSSSPGSCAARWLTSTGPRRPAGSRAACAPGCWPTCGRSRAGRVATGAPLGVGGRSRPATRRPPCPRCWRRCAAPAPAIEVVVVDDGSRGRDGRGRPGRRRHRPARDGPAARLDRQGVGLPPRRGDHPAATCCSSSTPTRCWSPTPWRPARAARAPRRTGVGAALPRGGAPLRAAVVLLQRDGAARQRRLHPSPRGAPDGLRPVPADLARRLRGAPAGTRRCAARSSTTCSWPRRTTGPGLPVLCAVGGDAIRMRSYPGGLRQLADGWTKNFASGASAAAPGTDARGRCCGSAPTTPSPSAPSSRWSRP